MNQRPDQEAGTAAEDGPLSSGKVGEVDSSPWEHQGYSPLDSVPGGREGDGDRGVGDSRGEGAAARGGAEVSRYPGTDCNDGVVVAVAGVEGLLFQGGDGASDEEEDDDEWVGAPPPPPPSDDHQGMNGHSTEAADQVSE